VRESEEQTWGAEAKTDSRAACFLLEKESQEKKKKSCGA